MTTSSMVLWVLIVPFLWSLWAYSATAYPVHPPPKPLPPPKPHPPVPRWVKCRLSVFPYCFNARFLCPLACPLNCLVDCVLCKPVCGCNYPGAVCQDPRFVGGDGLTFYFHGQKDQDFCLVSDPNLHINAHFIGKRNPNLTRDFTWVQSIAIMFDAHQIFVSAKKTSDWDDDVDRLEISFDGNPISLPAKEGSEWSSRRSPPRVTFTRTSARNGVAVEVGGEFKVSAAVVPISEEESRVHGYNITKEDCFAHLELGFKFYNLSDEVDGVLGQTYRREYVSRIKANVKMPVMGGLKKFSSSSLYATDCAASRFGQRAAAIRTNHDGAAHYSSLQCTSGINGNGVVCKR